MAAAVAEHDIYHPLSPGETRFLIISPSSTISDPIICQLSNFNLESPEVLDYEALSYTWGDDEASHAISVNSSPFKIRSNLYEALRHLRDVEEARVIWIDSICINQDLIPERNAQLLLMGKIFSVVKCVVIWLGIPNPGEERRLRHLSEGSWHFLDDVDAPSDVRERQRYYGGAIVERQWWLRSWTVQEFINSRDRVFVCGSVKLDSHTIMDLLDQYNEMSNAPEEDMHVYSLVKAMGSRKDGDLGRLMLHFGHRLATDPKDKIYAYLELVSDKNKLGIVPDYASSISAAYVDLVKKSYEKDGHMEIICRHYRSTHRASKVDFLPSWVPDWSVCRSIHTVWTTSLNGESFFSAGYPSLVSETGGWPHPKGLPPIGKCHIKIREHVLHASSIYIGNVSRDSTNDLHPQRDERDLLESIRSWRPADLESAKYANGKSKLDTFCETIVTDVFHKVRFSKYKNLKYKHSHLREFLSTGEAKKPVIDALRKASHDLHFDELSSGHYAMVPRIAKTGDVVAVLLGFSTPMVLRKMDVSELAVGESEEVDSTTYRMIGPCYVNGVMDGEVSDHSFEKIRIV
ncbi:unnamed protein product [Diplocarpon coronariae]|nr:hypothetical protein JHW43_001259 [Diplocarpon mali]